MIPEIKAEELANFKKPTALFLETNDNFITKEKGLKIVEAMSNGTFYSVPNSGHLPWLENPELIGKMILDFFKN
jgi:pimeloyl-ACP methyl ester carboxylesterase